LFASVQVFRLLCFIQYTQPELRKHHEIGMFFYTTIVACVGDVSMVKRGHIVPVSGGDGRLRVSFDWLGSGLAVLQNVAISEVARMFDLALERILRIAKRSGSFCETDFDLIAPTEA
jgi:hypothetical protein